MGHRWTCEACKHEWIHFDEHHRPEPCPKCKSTDVWESM